MASGNPKYGGSGLSYAEVVAQLRAEGDARENLERKTSELSETEERGASVEEQVGAVRTGLTDATQRLSAALSANITELNAETAAVLRNTQALEAKLAAVRALSSAGGVAGAEAGGAARSAERSAPVVVPTSAVEGDARYQAALAAQNAAERDAAAARSRYTAAVRPTSGVGVEDSAALLQQREAATQNLTAAKAETAAARKSAESQAQVATLQQQAVEIATQNNAAMVLEQRANEAAAAQAQAALQAAVVAQRAYGSRLVETGAATEASARAGAVGEGRVFGSGSAALGAAGLSSPTALAAGQNRALEQAVREATLVSGAPSTYFASRRGGLTTPPPDYSRKSTEGLSDAKAAEVEAYRAEVQKAQSAVAGLGQAELEANQAFQASSSAYAEASNSLNRYGNLNSEFIGALARGEVTLAQFGEQVTSTVGKFAGLAAAGALVYGAFEGLKSVVEGATATQAGIQTLGRFIPGLNGPAGGGGGQVGNAESTFRSISTQFNQPISQVVDAMQVMARTFHTVADAGEAARAVLAASTLDQVPPAQSEQYLVGIGNSLGYTKGSQLVGVVNQLNQLQASIGARVSQTLPGLARAVPVAEASGISENQVAALTALGVRGGISGNQVGTALLRSMGSFAFRPGSATIFGQYGIQAQPGNYGGLITQVMKLIDTQSSAGTLSGTTLRNLASALGGPLLGSRSILPILDQEALHPGLYDKTVGLTEHPRSYQEDLSAQLGSVSQRFKAIGISLQDFGSQFTSVGLLSPLEGLLAIVGRVTSVFESFLSPLSAVGHVFTALPQPLQDLLGILAAYKGAQAFAGSGAGNKIGRLASVLPGVNYTPNADRELVEGTLADLNQRTIPDDRQAYASALRSQKDAERQKANTIARQNQFVSENAEAAALASNPETEEHPAAQAYNARLLQFERQKARQQEQIDSRTAIAENAGQNLAQSTGLQRSLSDKSKSFADRAALAQALGVGTQEADNTMLERVLDAHKQLYEAIEQGVALQRDANGTLSSLSRGPISSLPGGGAANESAAAVTTTAASAALTSAVLTNVANDEPDVANVVQTTQQAEQDLGPSGVTPAAPGAVLGGAGPGAAAAEDTVAARAAAQASTPPPPQTAADRAAAFSTQDEALLAATGRPSLASRVTSRIGATAGGIATDQAPLAALIGSQFVGGIVGGGVGNDISTLGGDIGTGALLGQITGHAGLGLAGGLFAAGSALSKKGTLGRAAGGAVQGGALGYLAGLAGPKAVAAIGGRLGALFGGEAAAGAGAEGAGIAGAGLAAAEAETPIDTVAPEVGLPLQALTAAGGAVIGAGLGLLGIGGGGAPPTPPGAKAYNAVRAAQKGLGNVSPIVNTIDQGLTLGGSGGTSAQQQASTEISALENEQITFGTGSTIGKQAQGLETSALQATLESAAFNPVAASQLASQFGTGRETAFQNQFKATLATSQGVGGAQGAATTAEGQYSSELVPYASVVQSSSQALQGAQAEYDAAVVKGNQKGIDSAKATLATIQSQANAASSLYSLKSQAIQVVNQQTADASYGVASQDISAAGSLAQAQAGGNVAAGLRAQIATAGQTATAAGNILGTADPQAAQADTENAQAQARQAQTQLVQQGLTELKSRQAVPAAQIFTGDPIAQARNSLQNLQQQYEYIRKNAKSFDPADLNNALAAVISSQQSLADEISSYNTQMTQVVTQTEQAQEYGNQIAQAQTGLAGAAQQIKEARTPLQRAQAEQAYATAQGQQYQAQQAVISEQGQLAQSELEGNPVGQAQAAVQAAQKALAAAHGIDNVIQAQTALNQANYQLVQAQEAYTVSLGQLAASTTSNPLKQLSDQEKAVAQALKEAQAKGDVSGAISLKTQLNNLKLQTQSTLIEQRESTVQFQLDMYQITYSQAIQQLEGLLKVKDITLAQKQQIEEQIRQLELSDSTPGQFDLGPSNAQVKLPTVYDILQGMGGAKQYQTPGGGLTAPGEQANVLSIANDIANGKNVPVVAAIRHETTINIPITVAKTSDVTKVGQAIDKAMNTHVNATLRAKGMRGT